MHAYRPQPDTHGRQRSGRAGFSLLELVVVLALVGLLLSLTIPAVQSARASSRRIECMHHLRQIGVAMHNYHDLYGKFPGDYFEQFVQILPFIDQNALLDELKSGSNVYEMSVSIPLYVCPDDPVAVEYAGRLVSYRMSDGSGRQKFGGNGFYRDFTGPLPLPYPLFAIRAAHVTDGLSNTVAMSEILVFKNSLDEWGGMIPTDPQTRRRMTGATDESFYDPDQLDQFAEECRENTYWPDTVLLNPCTLGTQCEPYNHILTPNGPSCHNGLQSGDFESHLFRAQTADSLHRGGVNVLLGDGSAKFVSNSIDLQVWRAAGSRNGGESHDL